MEKILWIIAICEVIRTVQCGIEVAVATRDIVARGNVYEEFIKSLKSSDKEFVENVLREFEKQEAGETK